MLWYFLRCLAFSLRKFARVCNRSLVARSSFVHKDTQRATISRLTRWLSNLKCLVPLQCSMGIDPMQVSHNLHNVDIATIITSQYPQTSSCPTTMRINNEVPSYKLPTRHQTYIQHVIKPFCMMIPYMNQPSTSYNSSVIYKVSIEPVFINTAEKPKGTISTTRNNRRVKPQTKKNKKNDPVRVISRTTEIGFVD